MSNVYFEMAFSTVSMASYVLTETNRYLYVEIFFFTYHALSYLLLLLQYFYQCKKEKSFRYRSGIRLHREVHLHKENTCFFSPNITTH